MEQQELSNKEVTNIGSISSIVNINKQDRVNKEAKFNLVSTFLTKFIFGDNFDILKKAGFKNSFITDPSIGDVITLSESQRLLYLLFRDQRLTLDEFKRLVESLAVIKHDILFSYELVNNYCMIVINFPEEFITDYDLVCKGLYSKLSPRFKSFFPETKEVLNDKSMRMGREYTIYYHIFNKTEWLKNFWLERLGFSELDEKLELWEAPKEEDLIFDKNKII